MLTRIEVKNAGPGSLEVLCRLWHATWYSSHSPEAHHAYRMKLLTSAWARSHAQVLVLTEAGQPRSGLIVYTLPMRLSGRSLKAAGIAAVVTDPEHRGRGLAARLIQVAHRRLADSGHDCAWLFSDIGTRYYAALGYVPWPVVRHVVAISQTWRRMKKLVVRSARGADLSAQARLYREFEEPYDLVLERSLPYWRHIAGRARWRRQFLRPPGPLAASGRFIAWSGDQPLAYAHCEARDDDLVVTDAAHAHRHPEALAAILSERAMAYGRHRVTLAASATAVRALGVEVVAAEPVDKMMLAPLGGATPTAAALAPRDHCIWPVDWF